MLILFDLVGGRDRESTAYMHVEPDPSLRAVAGMQVTLACGLWRRSWSVELSY